MNDFSEYVYPKTPGQPTQFQSHAEFLRAGSLRYAINTALHDLDIAELNMVLGFVKMTHKPAKDNQDGND